MVADDRERFKPGNSRVILIIEDDIDFRPHFICDLAHELDFQSVVVHSAGDGLIAAAKYQPSAIVLDINLPDFRVWACSTS